MKKKYLIIGGVVICLIFIGLRLLLASRGNTPGNANRLDKIDPTQLPTADKVSVPGRIGDVQTNNFLRGAPEVSSQRVGIVDDPQSGIAYSPSDHTFYITISAVDANEFNQQRQSIEQQFLTKLGISQEQACQLQVVERTVPSPDPTVSDKEYGLSFCS